MEAAARITDTLTRGGLRRARAALQAAPVWSLEPPSGARSASSAPPLPAAKLDARRILCVASCKGGVGKSSISANLAVALAQRGDRVGLLDLDIYGPSLPSLMPSSVAGQKVTGNAQQKIRPLEWGHGIFPKALQLMSYGYLRPSEFAAIRGPMVAGIAQQLLTGVAWQDLDTLVIDMPPGTGDVHLTLSQQVAVDACVMVTTPQKLALVDVDKGIRMFDKVGIPTVAIVENMSFLECGSCGTRQAIFGEGGGKRLAEQFGIEGFHQLPLDPLLNGEGTGGSLPLASGELASRTVVKALNGLATQIADELAKARESRGRRERAEKADNGHSVIVKGGGLPDVQLPARTVRLACKCAYCIDEWTGQPKLDPKSVPMDVSAVEVEFAGRYAVTIKWSDEHRSIYSFKHLRTLA